MAMFDKVTDESTSSPGTVVGANVRLTGTLKDVNDITVHGQVEGEIISDRVVTVAETAKVKGPVTATQITIAGTVNGAVSASERCELLPSARVTGSITTADLSIKSGALFNGKATMAESKIDEKTKTETSKQIEEEIVDKTEPKTEIELLETPEEKKQSQQPIELPSAETTPTMPKAELED